jgi:hypothetical protein
VLDRAGTVLGDGTVPAAGHLIAARDDVRMVAPTRIWSEGQAPSGVEYARARTLAVRVGGGGTIDVSVVQGGGTIVAGRELTLSFYELHQDGRVRLVSAVWDGEIPSCVQVADVTGNPAKVYALASHCRNADGPGGSLVWVAAPGVRATSVRIEAVQPWERAYASTPETATSRGTTTVSFGREFPTGRGELNLADQQGRALPPARIPAAG